MWEGKMGRGGEEESMFSRSEDIKCCMGERMKWWQKKELAACVIAKIFAVVMRGSLEKEKSGIEKEYIYVSNSSTNFSF
ncbi:unnamed protein product [Meloidogyne enterolobii]|uniref:Uncharacterized protein n=1 Tax=Meloidogyne enterolobii TaxID=390850 RepID=A0ACB0YXN6_MELEN